jgi:eukaryotic-like serine/threonine-protein kinase
MSRENVAMHDSHTTLAGRYELAEVIGRGGMGTVYRAVDLVLHRSVAVKVLPGALADHDPSYVARFQREARAAAALSDPAVVAVYDSGSDDGTRFIVMEYVAGASLEAILREEGPLDPERAMSIAEQVAGALGAAHAAGIVHRDIKPANVMVRADESVKVLDFGLARALDASALTQSASVLGTAAYMSPEQALGKPADERSDIYSLGCLLYALLTGQPPFTGDGAAAILNQHAHIAPRPVHPANSRVSPALGGLVAEMLAKAPDERPQSAEHVRERLRSASAGTVAAPTALAAQTPAGSAPTRVLARRPHPRRRLVLAGLLSALGLVIALIALAAGGGPRHATPPSRSGADAAASATKQARSGGSTTSSTATTSASASRTAPQPQSVAGAAGVLSALLARDGESATIDRQAAQEITKALSDILGSYATTSATDAQHKLADLSQKLTTLAGQGHISPAAAPALAGAVSNLGTALAASAPALQTPEGGPAGQEHKPPGHGGEPPGKAKKHGD